MDTKLKSLLSAFAERPIAYQPIYTDIAGSLTAGILLSQIVYWWYAIRGKEFYKTDDSFCEEIRFSREEMKTAKKKLIHLKFVSIVKKGIPCKTYYTINEDRVINAIQLHKKDYPIEEPAGTELKTYPYENNKVIYGVEKSPVGGKATNCTAGKPPTNTETNTETNNIIGTLSHKRQKENIIGTNFERQNSSCLSFSKNPHKLIKYISVQKFREHPVVSEYFTLYEEITHCKHIPYKGERRQVIVDTLEAVEDMRQSLGVEWEDIMKRHFHTKYSDGCNHQLAHFASEVLLGYRIHEVWRENIKIEAQNNGSIET